jgi:hypothetical protein
MRIPEHFELSRTHRFEDFWGVRVDVRETSHRAGGRADHARRRIEPPLAVEGSWKRSTTLAPATAVAALAHPLPAKALVFFLGEDSDAGAVELPEVSGKVASHDVLDEVAGLVDLSEGWGHLGGETGAVLEPAGDEDALKGLDGLALPVEPYPLGGRCDLQRGERGEKARKKWVQFGNGLKVRSKAAGTHNRRG